MDRLSQLIGSSERIVVLTGAGISTASGIPDFRGPNGIWKDVRPVYYERFLRDARGRKEYWRQKAMAEPVMQAAEPNAVHYSCVDLEQSGRLDTVITQNIDGLHSDAGLSHERLVEVHGTGREAVCLSCGDRSAIGPHIDAFGETGEPPVCACGGFIKPATISFGQPLDPAAIQRATDAVDRSDLLIALGSTLGVYPVADLPLRAVGRGVPYVIVNIGATGHDSLPGLTLRVEDDVTTVFSQAVSTVLGG